MLSRERFIASEGLDMVYIPWSVVALCRVSLQRPLHVSELARCAVSSCRLNTASLRPTPTVHGAGMILKSMVGGTSDPRGVSETTGALPSLRSRIVYRAVVAMSSCSCCRRRRHAVMQFTETCRR